jgi:hypothetical protein
LEQQKADLQEAKAMWEEALGDIQKYIDGELSGLKEIAQEKVNNLNAEKQQTTDKYNNLLTALGNVQTYVTNELKEWQRLADDRKAIEEKAWSDDKDSIKTVINNGTLGVMALMTANGKASGEGYVQSMIDGINSKRAELQNALSNLMGATSAYQKAQVDIQPAGVPKLANEGYVRARPGGTLVRVGEGGVDEGVVRVDRLQPKFDTAMVNALRNVSNFSTGFMSSAVDIAAAIKEGFRNATFYGTVEVPLPDGTVRKEIVKFFADAGLGHAVRAS